MINCSLTLLVGGGQRLLFSLLTRPKRGGNGSLSKWPLRSRFRISGGMKFPPSTSPKWNIIGTKLRHKKRLPFFGRSSIRQWWLMSGMEKSQWRLTKVALIVAHSRWNWWNIGSIVVHSLNKGGDMLPTSFGNSLPKEESWPTKIFFYDAMSL